MCSTLLVETVEYYVSNNSIVYVLLIDASKAFDRLCHSKLFDVLETYNVSLSLDDYCTIFILKCMCSGTPLNHSHFSFKQWSKTGGLHFYFLFIFIVLYFG